MSKLPGERYTVAVDFDGVLHSYTTPWVDAETIPDPPVPGAIEWLSVIARDFAVVIFTTRGKTPEGQRAVRHWLHEHGWDAGVNATVTADKPPALIYIDDRAWRFEGAFPSAADIHAARPWNKKRPERAPVLAVDQGSAVSGANAESPPSWSTPRPAVAVAPHPPGMTTERLAELRKMSAGLFEDSRLGSMSFGTAERLENAFADLFREIDRLRLDAAAGLERERQYRARMMLAGSMICLPVSEKNLREAKELLTPAYHDAARDLKARRAAALPPESAR